MLRHLRNIAVGCALAVGLGLINVWLSVGLAAIILLALAVMTLMEPQPLHRRRNATSARPDSL